MYVKGIFKQEIFKREDTGFVIGLLKVKESSPELSKYNNKTLTFTGYFDNLLVDDLYTFNGSLVVHNKYGEQFNVESYEKLLPEEHDAMIDFLSSSVFKGIGEKTAKKIVDTLGSDTFNIILENPSNLLLIQGITEKMAKNLNESLKTYQGSYQVILKLNDYGFSTKESLSIYKKYKEKTNDIIDNNIYKLFEEVDRITFKKLDYIALKNGIDPVDKRRVEAGIIYALNEVINAIGHSYYRIEELYNYTSRALNTLIPQDVFLSCVDALIKDLKIVNIDNKYYLKELYQAEVNVTTRLGYLSRKADIIYKNIDACLSNLEKYQNIFYDEEQRVAIKTSITKNISIITGGPGTGKTTIINGIVSLYKELNRYSGIDMDKRVALLAPTGRASKRLTEATKQKASTIHRFLKWNKEDNTFQIDENNKSDVEFVIIDEASMVDVYLFDSLLRGLRYDTKIVIVGDDNQLPSVGPGQVLKDIIESHTINTIKLEKLYRQDEGSNIVTLAYMINNNEIEDSIFNSKDTYFIPCTSDNVINNIIEIEEQYKDLDYNKFQILAPLYKGLAGIDVINKSSQELCNPKSPKKNEIIINDVIYREGDKVIQLTNMPDDNVFNGDIGTITSIKTKSSKEVIIDFDDNLVSYNPADFQNFKHAYAISIHKSQGSEFDTVVIPLIKGYSKMLYRKLIYTGVTRAKKKLYIIGDIEALYIAANNNDLDIRRTTIKEMLIEKV